MDRVGEKVSELSNLIHTHLARISQLESEKVGASGDLKYAIDLLINSRVWKIQQAIGVFWRESLDITMPILPATITETASHSIPPFISGNF